MSIVCRSNCRGGAGVVIADVGQPCTACIGVLEGKAVEATPIDDQVRSQTAVVYTGDGKSLLSSGEDAAVKRWNADTLEEEKVYPRQSDWPQGLAVSPTTGSEK